MREFVVSGGDAPEILEPAKATFDDVATFISLLVVSDFLRTVGLAWNNGFDTALFEETPDRVGVVAFVGKELFDAGNHADAFLGHDAICRIAGCEDESPRPTQMVDYRMYLAVFAAFGNADRLIIAPPFPPPAQRWTLT